MRSSELARLAGVTPRTLRHYRNIGLLPEPPRTENNYCNYGMNDFFRLLRIKNLVSLGFSLEKVKEMLSEPDSPDPSKTLTYLDDLDKEIVAHIKQLEEQRQTIALLKKERATADVPVEFAATVASLIAADFPVDIFNQERDAIVFAAHLLNDSEKNAVASFFQRFNDETVLNQYRELNIRIYQLSENASEGERDKLARETVELVWPLICDVNIDEFDTGPSESDSLIETYETEVLNEVQKDITNRAAALLLERIEEKKKSSL